MANKKSPAHFAKQAQEVYELSLAGYSQRQIAEKMGIALLTVQKRLKLYIEDRVHPKADEYRNQQLARAQIYIRSLWSQILAGDPKAIAAAVRTEERISRLLGLDSATAFVMKAEITDDRTEFNKMLDKLMGQEGRTEREGNRPRRSTRPRVISGVATTPAHNPESEFRKDSTFEPHEVQPQAVTLAEDLEEFEPVKADPAAFRPARRRRGQPIPNPAAQFLRDNDDD
ncbi:hypothetical protein AB0918_24575 [Streptomyces sp. NPDC006864]|uniref:hypothetical protein n=1 Tax=Streptomyces sp. NPDC006864 TaxID=3154780 RepID=UPI0034553AD2